MNQAHITVRQVDRLSRGEDGTPRLPRSTVSGYRSEDRPTIPSSFDNIERLLDICLEYAKEHGHVVEPPLDDRSHWLALYEALGRPRPANRAEGGAEAGAVLEIPQGKPRFKWSLRQLGIRGEPDGEPTPYVRRQHDAELIATLRGAGIRNTIILLRGGPATGKSRSLHKALSAVRRLDSWNIVVVTGHIGLDAILRANVSHKILWLGDVRWLMEEPRPRTVERLLTLEHRSQGVVVVGELPVDGYLTSMAGVGGLDPHLKRLLNVCQFIDVADRFTNDEAAEAQRIWRPIAELSALVRTTSEDHRVTQLLAWKAELENHWRDTRRDPYGRAVISAVVDAARLGYRDPLPRDLVEKCASLYLDDEARVCSSGSWLTDALEYAIRPFEGGLRAVNPVGENAFSASPYLVQLGDVLDPKGADVPDGLIDDLLCSLPTDKARSAFTVRLGTAPPSDIAERRVQASIPDVGLFDDNEGDVPHASAIFSIDEIMPEDTNPFFEVDAGVLLANCPACDAVRGGWCTAADGTLIRDPESQHPARYEAPRIE